MSRTPGPGALLMLLYERAARSLAVRRGKVRAARIRHTAANCGTGFRVNGVIRFSGADRATIGDNVHVGDGAFIRAEGGLHIGDNTHISRNLVLYTQNHQYEGMALPYDADMVDRPVRIGRNVWIGMNVCIAPGTHVGDGAIIGMGTVLHGEVPPGAIVGPSPWRKLGQRDDAHYQRLERDGRYGGPGGTPIT